MKESKTKWIYVVKTVRVYKTMIYIVILCILGRIHIRGSRWSLSFAEGEGGGGKNLAVRGLKNGTFYPLAVKNLNFTDF